MATEMNEETDGNQISSISSTFNEMKIMMDDLDMDCLILLKKIVTKNLDEQDAISLHTNPTNIDEVSGSNRINNNVDTETSVQNNRDKGSHNTDAGQGSAVRGTPQKDTDFSIGDLFRNRKRHGSIDEDELPPIKNEQGDTAPS